MRPLALYLTLMLLLAGAGRAAAQYYDWGRSPAGIRWNQIEVPNGKVVYPDYFESGAAKMHTYLNAINPTLNYGFRVKAIKNVPILLHTQNLNPNGIVMWAPKRMELEAVPLVNPYAEPWLKQLAVHEGRHTVQYGNMYRGWFIKTLGVIFGQQAGLVSNLLLPMWALEGDAVQAETQAFAFGRALQPSFTIEYRAYMESGGLAQFPLDKWFCGSFRDYTPNHYQLGYQLVAWARETYGDEVWHRVLHFGTRHPYSIVSINPALHRYFRTKVRKIVEGTFDDLTAYWKSLPQEENSGEEIPTPVSSYTTYDTPMPVNDTTLVALKSDFDRTQRFVAVDPRTGGERTLFYTGSVNTPPTLRDSVIYWSELRSSTLWDQRVFSRAMRYDLRTGRQQAADARRNALFPTPLPEGELATIGYDYKGTYTLELNGGRSFPLPDSLSVHGLAYDEPTGTLAFIGLSDAGMAFYSVNPGSGTVTPLTRPNRITVFNLRAGDGKLSYNSIGSGKDEIHIYDLREKQEYRLTTSRYGSVSPSAPAGNGRYYFTAYSRQGYLLAAQQAEKGELHRVTPSYLPVNKVNPPRRKWPVVQLDTVPSPVRLDSTVRVRRYRKGTHLFNPHSWTPWNFNPFQIIDEDRLDISVGATLMSQNLLSNTSGFLSYGYWRRGGHQFRGQFNYYGLAPKIQVGFDYGGRRQLVYGAVPEGGAIPPLKRYFEVNADLSLPMTLASGYRMKVLTPALSFRHMNAKLYYAHRQQFKTGFQRLIGSLTYTDNVRMAKRDFLPRWGYALKFSFVGAPFNDDFGNLVSLYGRVFLPGAALHHSLMLRANAQYQNRGLFNFSQKELYPRGARYDFAAMRYLAGSVDYQLPLCYPDWGLSSIIYITRIRLNAYFDAARMERNVSRDRNTGRLMQTVTSYGGELFFDLHPLRIPVNATTVGIHVYKPSDRKGVVVGASLGLPF